MLPCDRFPFQSENVIEASAVCIPHPMDLLLSRERLFLSGELYLRAVAIFHKLIDTCNGRDGLGCNHIRSYPIAVYARAFFPEFRTFILIEIVAGQNLHIR